jgi:crotonobetainyl-CoA:carnitine CoA-transferase CaiB-like acyl-CoA transferase
VCVAITGFGLDNGDDPAFDYVIQAATGIAVLTGEPDGPPTLPGYSSVDNSTGLAAALGLLAQITSGRGGQVEISLRDVMLSQLNYHASAYLNDGTAERVSRRDEVIAVVKAALATDTAAGWEARLRPLGVPVAAVRTLPEALNATQEIVVTAGDFRLVGNPIRIAGYRPDYRPPPTLGQDGLA